MLCYELANARDQLPWYLHDGRAVRFERSLVLRDSLFARLGLIVCQDPLGPRLIPTGGKLVLPHGRCFLRRRRLKASRAFPSRVYAVMTNTLSGSVRDVDHTQIAPGGGLS